MANTLKFGAGQWATKEGSTLAYNDENNNFKPLPFTFTRASNATVVNKAGLIETVGNGIPRIDFLGNTQGALKLEPQRTNLITQSEAFGDSYWTKSGATIQADPSTAGSELVTNGNFATDSNWTKGTGWTISGGKAVSNSSVGFQSLSQSNAISNSNGKTFKCNFTISGYSSGTVALYISGFINNSYFVGANGDYEIYIMVSQGTSGNVEFLTNSSGFTGSIDNVSVKEVQGFTSPDGTNNAYKLVENSANSRHFINSTQFNTPDTVYSSSVYVKADGRNKIAFRENAQTGNYASFNLSNGTLIATNGISASIELISNGWYRINYQITSGANFILGIELLSDSYTSGDPYSNPYQGNGTSGVYIAFAQAELGSYATSYVPTQGSAVTRLRDECLKDDFSILTVGNSYTLFFDVDLNEKDDNKTFFNIKNTSAATSFTVRSVLGGVIRVYNNLDSQYPTDNLASSTSKWVVRIDGTSFKIFGAEGSLSGTLTTARDMGEGIFGRYSQTKINDFKVYNTALSDSECEALTQV